MMTREEESLGTTLQSAADKKAEREQLLTDDEKRAVQQEVDSATREIDAAIAMGGDASKLQSAKQSIGNSAVSTKAQAEDVKREAEKAKDVAREEEGKKIMQEALGAAGIILPLAALNALAQERERMQERNLSFSEVSRAAYFTGAMANNLGNIGLPQEQRGAGQSV